MHASLFTPVPKAYLEKDILQKTQAYISLLFILACIAGVIYYHNRLYTAITLLICAFTLLFRVWAGKRKSLSRFYLAFAICLVPFFIVNTILTSLPVITYDESQMIGFRLYTIPLEDIFFFMVLLLWNIGLYNYLKNRFTRRIKQDPPISQLTEN